VWLKCDGYPSGCSGCCAFNFRPHTCRPVPTASDGSELLEREVLERVIINYGGAERARRFRPADSIARGVDRRARIALESAIPANGSYM